MENTRTTPTENITESDVNTRDVNSRPSTPPRGGPLDPVEHPYTRARVRAHEKTTTNGTEEDTQGVDNTDVNTPRQPPADDTESDVNGEPDTTTEPKRPLPERAAEFAERWGLDLYPPKLADAGLPPLNDSRAYAERGDQAPSMGPTRFMARAFDYLARPLRWFLAAGYHVLARPGRTLVALVLLGLLARVHFVRETLAFAWALVDFATYWAGLQWLLGLT